MIETVSTFSFIQEYNTSTSPMLFVCQSVHGFENYFVKYIHSQEEFDGLAYEIVCNRLATHFKIPSPDIALVNVELYSYEYENLKYNRADFHADVIAFGSREITLSDMLSKLDSVPDKHTFNLYANPLDLVKIILFDLQIDNRDRGEENFNLLVNKVKPSRIFAIDHFHAFCGAMNWGSFHPGIPFNINSTLIRSPFFYQMLSYLQLEDVLRTVEDYFYLCSSQAITDVLHEAFADIPTGWVISHDLETRIRNFILDSERLKNIRQQATNLLSELKRNQK